MNTPTFLAALDALTHVPLEEKEKARACAGALSDDERQQLAAGLQRSDAELGEAAKEEARALHALEDFLFEWERKLAKLDRSDAETAERRQEQAKVETLLPLDDSSAALP